MDKLDSLKGATFRSKHLGYPPYIPALEESDTAQKQGLRGFSWGLMLGRLHVSETGLGLKQDFATAY